MMLNIFLVMMLFILTMHQPPFSFSIAILSAFLFWSSSIMMSTNSFMVIAILFIYVSGLMVIFMMMSFCLAKLMFSKNFKWLIPTLIFLMISIKIEKMSNSIPNQLFSYSFSKNSWLLWIFLFLVAILAWMLVSAVTSKSPSSRKLLIRKKNLFYLLQMIF